MRFNKASFGSTAHAAGIIARPGPRLLRALLLDGVRKNDQAKDGGVHPFSLRVISNDRSGQKKKPRTCPAEWSAN